MNREASRLNNNKTLTYLHKRAPTSEWPEKETKEEREATTHSQKQKQKQKQ